MQMLFDEKLKSINVFINKNITNMWSFFTVFISWMKGTSQFNILGVPEGQI